MNDRQRREFFKSHIVILWIIQKIFHSVRRSSEQALLTIYIPGITLSIRKKIAVQEFATYLDFLFLVIMMFACLYI